MKMHLTADESNQLAHFLIRHKDATLNEAEDFCKKRFGFIPDADYLQNVMENRRYLYTSIYNDPLEKELRELGREPLMGSDTWINPINTNSKELK